MSRAIFIDKRIRLTAEIIKAKLREAAETSKRIEMTDGEQRGLQLGITPTGIATWSLRKHDPSGRLRRFSLGRYPEMAPPAARRAAQGSGVQVADGRDPVAEKRKHREVGARLRAGLGTLGHMLNLYEQGGNPPPTWHTGAGRPAHHG